MYAEMVCSFRNGDWEDYLSMKHFGVQAACFRVQAV